MTWLNYHHLLYFWTVAREGSLARASAELLLAQSTVSKQVHQLEEALGHPLLARSGRRLTLTDSGRVVFRYAEEIFGLGREMFDTLRDMPSGTPMQVSIGIADVVPKLLAERVLAPSLLLPEPARLVCREGKPPRLLADLSLHELDMVLSDAPAPPDVRGKAFSHLLIESDVTFFGSRQLARKYRRGFPGSMAEAPMLLPTENTVLRRSIDRWLDSIGVRPNIVGEFEDTALLAVFGLRGAGLFPSSSVVAAEVESQYRVEAVGRVPELREQLYAITVERRIKHPTAMLICETARTLNLHPQTPTGKRNGSTAAPARRTRLPRG